MKKEIKQTVRDATDTQLIYWIQDINKEFGEQKYTESFRKAVHEEILRRGDTSTKQP